MNNCDGHAEARRAELDRPPLETLIRFLRRLGLRVEVDVEARPAISERRRLGQSDGCGGRVPGARAEAILPQASK